MFVDFNMDQYIGAEGHSFVYYSQSRTYYDALYACQDSEGALACPVNALQQRALADNMM